MYWRNAGLYKRMHHTWVCTAWNTLNWQGRPCPAVSEARTPGDSHASDMSTYCCHMPRISTMTGFVMKREFSIVSMAMKTASRHSVVSKAGRGSGVATFGTPSRTHSAGRERM